MITINLKKGVIIMGFLLLNDFMYAACPSNSRCTPSVIGKYQCLAMGGYVYVNKRGFVSMDSLKVIQLEGLLVKMTSKYQPGYYTDPNCSKKEK